MTALSKNAGVAGFLYNGGSLVGVVRLIYIPNTLIVSENATATVILRGTSCCSVSEFSADCLPGPCGYSLRWLFIVCLRESTGASLC